MPPLKTLADYDLSEAETDYLMNHLDAGVYQIGKALRKGNRVAEKLIALGKERALREEAEKAVVVEAVETVEPPKPTKRNMDSFFMKAVGKNVKEGSTQRYFVQTPGAAQVGDEASKKNPSKKPLGSCVQKIDEIPR